MIRTKNTWVKTKKHIIHQEDKPYLVRTLCQTTRLVSRLHDGEDKTDYDVMISREWVD
jgi:hypothetical protein